MTNNQIQKRSLLLIMLISTLFIFSCKKVENLFLSDSEILMKDIKGNYTLSSIRHEDFYSVDGGVNFILDQDTTYVAQGYLNLESIDKADYTGSLKITYVLNDEIHKIHGSASRSGDDDKLWLITDNEDDIQSMFLYSPVSSYIEALLTNRTENGFTLKIAEISHNYAGWKNRYFTFSK